MILFSSEALSDIERIRSFLEVRNPAAAVRAMGAIWSALERVEQFPEIGQSTKDQRIRQIVVRFGKRAYVVRYQILRPGEAIFVTRMWHSRELRE